MSAPDRILELLRRALDGGQPVEIDGLGVFRLAAGGGYQFAPDQRPRVFIAYAVEDLGFARRLRDSLAEAGCAPWLDKDQLLAGQNWPRAIERAISISDAFVACFSRRSVAKRGHFQSELRFALNCALQLPMEDAFILPVRLEPCRVPRHIAVETQDVDLFPDRNRGVERLSDAAHHAAQARTMPVLR
jgi:hypothetical protein